MPAQAPKRSFAELSDTLKLYALEIKVIANVLQTVDLTVAALFQGINDQNYDPIVRVKTATSHQELDIHEGGAQAGNDQSCDAADPLLEIPHPSDTLAVIVSKMAALARATQAGKNLAVCTGFKGAKHQERNPVVIAKAAMTPSELLMYKAWKAGATLESFDWQKNREPTTNGKGAAKRYSEQATAMDIAWDHTGATPENVAWLQKHMIHALPLIKAIVRVTKAEVDLCGGSDELAGLDMAELQTIHKVVAISTRKLSQEEAAMHSIIRSTRTLRARADALMNRINLRYRTVGR
ncbi:hypothetical protein SEPCBS119000_002092 [Sporothrix epigloea]|uniref:Uncharacterized protein n=1 Tax=Sporothrix epigloea TaxID=1892477 RepID=A0ABP0DEA2_9PEZI